MPVGRIRKVYSGRKTTVKPKSKYVPKGKIKMSQLPQGVRPEMKRKNLVIENETTYVLGNSLGSIMQCFHTLQGPANYERNGLKVQARGIHIKGHFYNRNGNPAYMIRMLVLQDKTNNIATFNGDELLMKAGNAVSHAQGTESSYLSVNKNRYKVYSDKLIKLSSANTNAENLKIFNTFIKLNIPIKYDGPSFGDIATNNIQIVYWPINPSNTVSTTEQIQANYSCTAYYQDA